MAKTKNLPALKQTDLLSPEQLQELRSKLPEWVLELEEKGTAVLRWNAEFLILVEELLRKDHGFSEKDLVKLEKRIKEMLPHLHKMTLEGLILLRPQDMSKALDIVDENTKILKKERSPIALPSRPEIIKRLSG